MFRKAILLIICAILLWQASGLINEAEAQAQDRLVKKESFWTQVWNWLKDHTFAFSIITVTVITVFSTVMATLKKDKLLKSLAGHLVTIELKGSQPDSDGERHRGRLRVESEGLEVVEEQVNSSNEKVSYLLREDEQKNIHAIIRYHDFLTDIEKEEREREVNRVYHPSIGVRLRRKIRNVVNEMKRVATEAFSLVFGKVREQFGKYAKELEEKGAEAVTFATTATYDALIDKLIGTRVVVRVKDNLEYVGVLKDYTSQFIQLLNVDYRNRWQTTVKRDEGSKHQRGLTLQKDGDDIVIRSRSPFKVTLKHIYWQGDRPDAKREKINQTIEPFGELRLNIIPRLNVTVSPFQKLELPTSFHYQSYKTIDFHFESVRVADVVLLKNYGLVRHRTEKFDAKILDFGALADAMLTSKDEELVLEGNPATTPLTIYNGYLTNLPKERLDAVAVGAQIHKRWTVRNFFAMIDRKLRPVSNHYFLGFLPLTKSRRVLATLAAIQMIHSDGKRENDPLLPFAYSLLCNANYKKRCKTFRHQVMTKKKRRILGFIPRPTHV